MGVLVQVESQILRSHSLEENGLQSCAAKQKKGMIVRIELQALEIEVEDRSAAQLNRDIEQALKERHR